MQIIFVGAVKSFGNTYTFITYTVSSEYNCESIPQRQNLNRLFPDGRQALAIHCQDFLASRQEECLNSGFCRICRISKSSRGSDSCNLFTCIFSCFSAPVLRPTSPNRPASVVITLHYSRRLARQYWKILPNTMP